ncbi:MAG: sensor domain-containing diguanylate cyclase [Chitinispirillales bacterium]|jgi:diguanylate cyclase (GGDEF)-like protein/PAS domain S-box-containing protein|nr:sensor domain-containing diguanylate cyclase [Chitinispirillales bacterium]
MRFSKRVPELGKILQRQRPSASPNSRETSIADDKGGNLLNSKMMDTAVTAALAGFNAVVVCAAVFLPLAWYTIIPLLMAALLWNVFWAISICKQININQTDINKNRVLFKRFQNTTKYFESMLQDTSDMIMSLDKEYLIFKFNRGAQKLLGYSQEEILGKPFEALFLNAADRDKIYWADDGDIPAGAEISMKTMSGNIIIVNMSMSKMRDGGFVVTAQDITEKKKLEEQLKEASERLNRLAITDDLTELYNSRHFYVAIKSELSRIKRHPERKFSLLYMDVDKFKEYNDSEGHLMGDSVLKMLGDVINQCLRKDIDAGFRYGGDEFVITLPDTDKNQAKIVARRILEQFCALKLGKTSLSIGIAEAYTEDDEKTIVKRADEAMYASKKKGGKCVSIAGEDC